MDLKMEEIGSSSVGHWDRRDRWWLVNNADGSCFGNTASMAALSVVGGSMLVRALRGDVATTN
jgi:hypothetical protein